MDNLMTQGEFAKYFAKQTGKSMSQPRISQLKASGKIPEDCFEDVFENGCTYSKIIPGKALKALIDNLNPIKARGVSRDMDHIKLDGIPDIQAQINKERKKTNDLTLSEAQRLKTIAQVSLLSIQIKKESKELISRADAMEEQAEMGALTKSQCMSFCDRVAPACVAMDNIPDIVRYLRKEMKTTLSVISKWELPISNT